MRELERDSHHPPSATQSAAQSPIAVVGRGRLGAAIAAHAEAAGLEVRVTGRDRIEDACAGAQIALLCVPDAEIEAACGLVAALAQPPRFVAHPSGATGLHALDAARARGCGVFSIHPLQTVPDGGATVTGAAAAISGSDAEALALARSLAETLGMRPFEVSEEMRAAYHAAAAIASNFLITLEESAAELLAAAGIEDGRELLAPLVLRTAANWAERGPEALTGPIARGDEQTVASHREALAALAPELTPLYEELAARTRELAAPRRPAP